MQIEFNGVKTKFYNSYWILNISILMEMLLCSWFVCSYLCRMWHIWALFTTATTFRVFIYLSVFTISSGSIRHLLDSTWCLLCMIIVCPYFKTLLSVHHFLSIFMASNHQVNLPIYVYTHVFVCVALILFHPLPTVTKIIFVERFIYFCIACLSI